MRERFYPLPEALPRGSGSWDIRPAGATPGEPCTNMLDRVMSVPLGDSPLHRIIRAHEMAHAKWSPEKLEPDAYGCSLQSLHMAEEARVNSLLADAGFDTSVLRAEEVDRAAVRAAVEAEDWRRLVMQAAASIGSGRLETFYEAINETDEGRKLCNPITDRIITPGQRFMEYEKEEFTKSTVPFAQLLDGLTNIPPNEFEPSELPDQLLDKIRRDVANGLPDSEWGRMTIKSPSLVRSLIGKIGRKKRATDEGCVPRRMDRWATDGAIFDRKRKQAGGTVLIDASGSMHLSPEEIEEVVLAAPGCTVAMYSGERGEGKLTLLAKQGRTATARDMTPRYRGNCVDGPALDWLARQEQPRLWVCDGFVTGIDDQLAPNLTLDAQNKCRIGGIKRLGTVPEATEYLKKQ